MVSVFSASGMWKASHTIQGDYIGTMDELADPGGRQAQSSVPGLH